MLRFCGYWLYATSIIHVLVGVWLYAEPLVAISQNGFFNAVDPYCDRNTAFWFLMFVPLLFAIGQLCCWAQVKGITLPTFLGWYLLATSIVGIVLMPISGFWLLIIPSVLIVIASHQSKSSNTSISYKA
ncbi:MAG: hypothetical protein N4J56_001623 [Chroococcidiopsis sp. SAG 2025]|uniref:DUF6463 family protein n=1 Tax=Chroococcidiopsis sp. SAG 2025 TaxID=171389 RepID=UPI0029371C76|nr:DUF6463 family protein [Chroococcidiopsis sp. SAG 2025]MDV2991969.1 hypothetical protein [Chroococcidiopsis sp. SAG 2025]